MRVRAILFLVVAFGCLSMTARSAVDPSGAWTAISTNHAFERLINATVDYSTPGGLYALSGWSVYRSGDLGKTWSPITMWPTMHQIGTKIVTFPKYPKTLVVFTYDQVGISSDAGATWETNDLPKSHWSHVLAVDPRKPSRMYDGVGKDVFITEDSGKNWTRHQVLPSDASPFLVSVIAVSPVDGTVFTGSSPAGALDGGGASRTHVRETAKMASYKSTNAGVSWKAMPSSGEKMEFYDWVRVLAADPRDPRMLYAGGAAGIRGATFLRSMNGGESWSYWNDSPVHDWITSIAVDPGDTRRIYVSTYSHGVFTSTDGGDSWVQTNEGLPASALSAAMRPMTLMMDERDPDRLYAITGDGLYVRTY